MSGSRMARNGLSRSWSSLISPCDHVDAKTVGAAIEPEADDVVNRLDHFRISKIQVRLLLEKHVQVPRRGRRVVLPRAAAEVALPVGRRTIGRAGNPDVPVAFRIAARRSRLDEPRMLIRGVIRHQVDDHADAAAMRLRHQPIERGEIAEVRMDAAVVADVVAPVVERRRVDRDSARSRRCRATRDSRDAR